MKLSTVIPAGLKFLIRVVENQLGIYSPFFAQWEISYKCNLKCVFCNVYKDHSYHKTELDTEQAFRLLRQMKKAGIIFLNITGGEPLLRKDIHLILRYAKKLGFLVTMNCNATLLEHKLDVIKGNIDTIHLSLDSDNAKDYEKLRGVKGAFDKVISGIDVAKKEGIHVGVNMTVTKDNFKDMERLCEFLKPKGVDLFLTIMSVIPTEFNDTSDASALVVDRHEYYRAIKSLKKRYPFIKTSDAYLEFVKRGGFDDYQCNVMRYMLNIKPDGSVVLPCGYFPFGKFNGSLTKIIHSKEFKRLTCKKRYPFCKECTLSCNFIPNALMDMNKWPSLLSSYL